MHARVTRHGCVANWKSGQHSECRDCPLAKQRGARGTWESHPQPRMKMGLGVSEGHAERVSEAAKKRWAVWREQRR